MLSIFNIRNNRKMAMSLKAEIRTLVPVMRPTLHKGHLNSVPLLTPTVPLNYIKDCMRFIIYNRLPIIQISMFSSFNQILVVTSRRERPAKPPGAMCIMQSTTTWSTDWPEIYYWNTGRGNKLISSPMTEYISLPAVERKPDTDVQRGRIPPSKQHRPGHRGPPETVASRSDTIHPWT